MADHLNEMLNLTDQSNSLLHLASDLTAPFQMWCTGKFRRPPYILNSSLLLSILFVLCNSPPVHLQDDHNKNGIALLYLTTSASEKDF